MNFQDVIAHLETIRGALDHQTMKDYVLSLAIAIAMLKSVPDEQRVLVEKIYADLLT